jgi:hypothetical protein
MTDVDPNLAKPRVPRKRIERVRELWLSGRSDVQIQHIVSAEFRSKRNPGRGVCCRQIRTDIKRVRDEFAQGEPLNVEAARNRSEAMLLETYRRARSRKGYTMQGVAYSDPDLKTMAVCAHRLAELFGAMAPQKLALTGAVEVSTSADAELLAKLTRAATPADSGGESQSGGATPSAVPVAPVGPASATPAV